MRNQKQINPLKPQGRFQCSQELPCRCSHLKLGWPQEATKHTPSFGVHLSFPECCWGCRLGPSPPGELQVGHMAPGELLVAHGQRPAPDGSSFLQVTALLVPLPCRQKSWEPSKPGSEEHPVPRVAQQACTAAPVPGRPSCGWERAVAEMT